MSYEPPDVKSYDPVEDEHKEFLLAQFVAEAKAALDEFEKTFTGANEWMTAGHTFREWMGNFHRWMSW